MRGSRLLVLIIPSGTLPLLPGAARVRRKLGRIFGDKLNRIANQGSKCRDAGLE